MTAISPTLDSQLTSTALGPVETAVLGEGHPVLVLHGSPGGIDAAELMSRFLPRDRFRAILVSRPGYLGTELGDRATIDQQADLMAALLDELGIDRAAVLSWSGGGPASYRLAVRHPDRVSALVTAAAVSKTYHLPKDDLSSRLMLGTAGGRWLLRVLAAHAPKQYISGTLSSEGDLSKEQLTQRVEEVLADPVKRDFVLGIGQTAEQDKRRATGYRNDLAQFAAIESLRLESIAVPTMIIQGSADSDVLPEHSDFAASTIPGAQLITLEAGTHLALYTHPDAEAAQRKVIDFVDAHSAQG